MTQPQAEQPDRPGQSQRPQEETDRRLSVRVERDEERGVVTLHLAGEADCYSVPLLKQALLNLLEEPATQRIILEIKGLAYADSTFVGAWLAVRRLVLGLRPGRRVSLTVTGAQGRVNEYLDRLGVREWLETE